MSLSDPRAGGTRSPQASPTPAHSLGAGLWAERGLTGDAGDGRDPRPCGQRAGAAGGQTHGRLLGTAQPLVLASPLLAATPLSEMAGVRAALGRLGTAAADPRGHFPCHPLARWPWQGHRPGSAGEPRRKAALLGASGENRTDGGTPPALHTPPPSSQGSRSAWGHRRQGSDAAGRGGRPRLCDLAPRAPYIWVLIMGNNSLYVFLHILSR